MQNITRCLNMFCIGDPSYHATDEELLCVYEDVPNKSMVKAPIKVSAKAHHDVPLNPIDAGLINCEVSVDGSW